MNNQSTQFDILPKIIQNQHKLLEPAFIKNTQMRFSQNESQILPHIPRRSSMMQGNSKQMVVHCIMGSFDFNNRHFGAACDRGFQGLSNYHISQKFGQFSVKLRPLERSVIDGIEGDEIEIVPKEERDHYKRIYKHENIPILSMVKCFQIDWLPDQDSEVNKKTSTSLQMNFHTALSILNTFTNTQEFFEKNLQLLERNTVAIKQKGINHLTQKVGKFSNVEFPTTQIIKNQNGLGYFKISYPIIEIYFQQYQYMGVVNLTANKLYDLVKNNFVELEYIVKEFTIDKSKFKIDVVPNQDRKKSSPKILDDVLVKPEGPRQQNEQIQHQQTQQLTYNDLGLIIIEKLQEFPEKTLQKRQIKQVVQKDEKSFYVVDFLPNQLLIKEKVSQKIIKMYSPTIKEFNDLLNQLQSRHFKDVLEQYVETQFDMPPEAFDYKDFKKGTKIKFNLPQNEELLLEITEQQLNNGLSQQWIREIEINNKDLQIIAEPCVFEIYNQVTCHTERRICSSKDLTKVMQSKYMIQFKLI